MLFVTIILQWSMLYVHLSLKWCREKEMDKNFVKWVNSIDDVFKRYHHLTTEILS